MKPNQLLAFVAIAEHLSMRGAARALGVTQPAVSSIVRELEREFDTPLVERGLKGVRLTPCGESLATRARLLLADMRRAREEIAQIRDGTTGRLAVAATPSVALTVMPAAFEAFHARLPTVDVRIREASLPWMLARLRDGQLDLAAAPLLPGGPGMPGSEFEAIELAPMEFMVGMRTGHPLRRCKSLRRLHAAEWVLPGNDALGRQMLMPIFSSIGLNLPARMILSESIMMALGLVGRTDAVGLFLEPLVALGFKYHGIRSVEVKEKLPTLQVCVIKLKDHRLTPSARQFVECMQLAATPPRAPWERPCGVEAPARGTGPRPAAPVASPLAPVTGPG
jgi:LysR family transcriptional regulator, regulator of abg operon